MKQWESDLTSSQREEIRAHVRHEWRVVQHTTQMMIDLFFGELARSPYLRSAVLDSLIGARSQPA